MYIANVLQDVLEMSPQGVLQGCYRSVTDMSYLDNFGDRHHDRSRGAESAESSEDLCYRGVTRVLQRYYMGVR